MIPYILRGMINNHMSVKSTRRAGIRMPFGTPSNFALSFPLHIHLIVFSIPLGKSMFGTTYVSLTVGPEHDATSSIVDILGPRRTDELTLCEWQPKNCDSV